jgi:hypothetical protein
LEGLFTCHHVFVTADREFLGRGYEGENRDTKISPQYVGMQCLLANLDRPFFHKNDILKEKGQQEALRVGRKGRQEANKSEICIRR